MSQTRRNVSLASSDPGAIVAILSLSWSEYAKVNWSGGQPCAVDPLKGGPFVNDFGTSTSSVVVKCATSREFLGFRNWVRTAKTNPDELAKNVFSGHADNYQKMPENAVRLFGYITKSNSDIVRVNVYLNPDVAGFTSSEDFNFTNATSPNMKSAKDFIQKSGKWVSDYVDSIEASYFSGKSSNHAFVSFQFALDPDSARTAERQVQERARLAAEADAAKRSQDEALARVKANAELAQRAQAEAENRQTQANAAAAKMTRETEERQRAEAVAAATRQRELAEQQRLALVQARPTPPPLPTPAPVGILAQRRALVIGNDSYRHVAKLFNAREDARSISKSLMQVGYQVTLVLDMNEKEIKAAIRRFVGQIDGGDEVMVFFSGHGVQINAANFLLPVDIAGESESQIRDEAISLQRILDDISERRAKLTLAIIDACRDNPFKSSGKSLGGRGLSPTTVATGQMIIYSAGSGQQALDRLGPADNSKNGLFTRVFLKEMQTPGISIDKVLRNVRDQVVGLARSVGHDQVPAIYDQVVGEFFFRK